MWQKQTSSVGKQNFSLALGRHVQLQAGFGGAHGDCKSLMLFLARE